MKFIFKSPVTVHAMSNKKRVIDLTAVSDESAKAGQLPAFEDSSRRMKKNLVDLTVESGEGMRVHSPLSKSAWSPASASKSAHSTHRESKGKRQVSKPEPRCSPSPITRLKSKEGQDSLNNTVEGQSAPPTAPTENASGVDAISKSPHLIQNSAFEEIPTPPENSGSSARSVVKDKSYELTHQDQQKNTSKNVEMEGLILRDDLSRDKSLEQEEDVDLLPLSLEVFQGILRKTLAELRETHQALVKVTTGFT